MIVIVALSIVTDLVFESAGIFSPVNQPELFTSWMAAIALLYRFAYGVLGGYITARLAPSNPQKHVMVLAGIGTVMGILGAVANWKLVSPGTEWYPILLVPASLVAVIGGGKLAGNRKK